MESRRLHLSSGMRQILTYPKFAGPTRLLILETGYFFDGGWRRAAEALGWKTASVSSVMVGGLTRDEVRSLFTTLAEFKPDFILASNYAGMDTEALFAHFYEDARIPYVSWFTDTPRMILYERTVRPSFYQVAATWERAYTDHFTKLGFQHVPYLPLATAPALFYGAPVDQHDRNLAFVGQSMIGHAAEAWDKLHHAPELADAIRKAFNEGRVTRERFAEGIVPILGAELLAGRTPQELRTVELLLVYEATRRQREALVKRLEPLGIKVRGDPAWAQVTANAAGGIGYFTDLAAFYRGTAVNLNSTSLQMKTSVNQRVFDCPAAGGFLLTDHQADLEELFDADTEVATYASLDELADKAGHYLRHPEARREIVLRAQRRVLAHHTLRHRLEFLEAYLKERFAS